MKFLYRLLFTRDDDLDLLQVIFLGWVVFVSFCVWKVGTKEWDLPTAAWSVIGSVFATLAIAGTPTWIAKLIAKAPDDQKAPPLRTYHSFEEADAKYYGVDDPPEGA